MHDEIVDAGSGQSLSTAIYGKLRSDVLEAYWQPGQKLSIQLLRGRYASGATPIREALNRLTVEGLVRYNEQRGFMVAEASEEELRDLVQNRMALEAIALEQALKFRSQAWEERLVLAFHRLSRAARSTDPDKYQENPVWEQLHRDFHRALLEGCQSATLLGFCDQLYDRTYRYRQMAIRKAFKVRNELEEHRAIYDAALAGDLETVKTALSQHYSQTEKIILTQHPMH